MADCFDLALMLANGAKHFVPTKPSQPRAVTTADVGFSQEYSDEFTRPLNVETVKPGHWISADDLVEKLLAFWQAERAVGKF